MRLAISLADTEKARDRMEKLDGTLAKMEKSAISDEHKHRITMMRTLMLGTLAFLDADIVEMQEEGIAEIFR